MKKTWIVTGSATGIGASIARAAMASGANVVATDINAERLKAAYDGVDNVRWFTHDIRDASQSEAVVAKTIEAFGRIDVLVNNAGYGQFGYFEQISQGDAEAQFSTNVFGTFNVTRAVLPIMRKQRSGHIFTMSSNSGFYGIPGASMYSASKFALEGFIEALAGEVAPFGIRNTLIEPGAFRTDFLTHRAVRYGTLEVADYAQMWARLKAIFDERDSTQIGDPDRLAAAVLVLLDAKEPPIHYVAGADALERLEAKVALLQAEMHTWHDLIVSTDFSD